MLSFGLPVFNGERFIEQAVTSLLTQTVDDLEVVVSDNASTDRTVEIVERLARRDPRVRLIRQPTNRGVVENFDQVVLHARGRFFAWAAHDDVREPDFARRCLDALATAPSAVLAFTRATSIDDQGHVIRSAWGARHALGASSARERFRAALERPIDPMPLPLFGVIRSEMLARTGLLVPGPHYDRALVAELAIHGPFVEVADPLFHQREHAARIGPSIAGDGREAARRLGSTSRLPHWQLLGRHLASVHRGGGRPTAVSLHLEVARWAVRERAALIDDVIQRVAEATDRWPVVGRRLHRAADARPTRRWARRTRRLVEQLVTCTPTTAQLVLIDDDSFGALDLGSRVLTPLWLRDGASWGVPASEAEIVAELEARRAEGATHVAVAWPARWVLDFHELVRAHLGAVARQVSSSDDLTVYEFTPTP